MRILPPPLAACRRALLVAAAAVISSPSSRAGADVDSTAGLRLDGAALQRAQQALYAPLPEVRSVSLSQCPVSPQQPTAAGCSGLERGDLVAATGSGPERRALGACVPAGALRCSCAYLTRCGALVPTQSRSPCLGVPGSPWALLPGRGSSGGLRPCRCSGKARRCETRSASRRISGAPFFNTPPPLTTKSRIAHRLAMECLVCRRCATRSASRPCAACGSCASTPRLGLGFELRLG